MAQPRRNLSVEIRVLSCSDPYPTRKLVLRSPTYAIRIGRGSKSNNTELCPAGNNAWFDNRVMSREHAVLKADPDTQHVYIEDVGSMHGTQLDNRTVTAHERHRISDKDSVIFGSEVTRGPDSFLPLRVCVRLFWIDDSSGKSQARSKAPQQGLPSNTFQVPDFDDEDAEDDEISFVQETVLGSKLEEVAPPQTRIQHDVILPSVKEAVSCLQKNSGVDLTPLSPLVPLQDYSKEAKPDPKHDPASTSPTSAYQINNLANSEPEWQAEENAAKPQHSPTCPRGRPTSPTLQMPATSHTTPADHFQSGANQGHLVVQDAPPDGEQSSVRVASLQTETSIVDDNLTESESSSATSSSPAPMVDDSEDEPTSSQVDPVSTPDQDALLTEVRSSKAKHVEGWTDSESTDSIFDEDFDDECGENMLERVEFAEGGMKDPPSVRDGFDESEKWCAEREPVSYDMRSGDLIASGTRPSLVAHSMHRPPSPSDAAMMKSCEYPSGMSDAQGAPYQDAYTSSQNWTSPMPPTYNSAWQYSFDGRQPIPFDGNSSAVGSQYNTFLTPPQLTPEQLRGFVPCASMVVNQSTAPVVNDGPIQPYHGGDSVDSQIQWQPHPQPNPITDALKGELKECVPTAQSGVPSAAAKVAINSIVEHVPAPIAESKDGSKLKRKADNMENSGDATLTQGDTQKSTQEVDGRSSMEHTQSQFTRIPHRRGAPNNPFARAALDARPAKRVRMNGGNDGPSFGTLAATALAGAVVGGVGVVAALVSLPQDFFV